MKMYLTSRIYLFLLTLALVTPVAADWINLTGAETSPNIAEIYVLDDHVKLVLEVYIGDLDTFDPLIPDDWLQDEARAGRPGLEERMRSFAQQGFRIRAADGSHLTAQLQLVEPRERVDRQSPFAGMINPITRQRVPEAPADKRVLYAEIIYPFEGRPQQLTIVPPLDEEGRAIVTIGFITYHKSVPVVDFRYLGQPARLNLDWDDPWYTKFDNPNLKRHHKDALMSFLYVEPFEVRHEVLTRVKDLEQWMDTGLRGREYIEVDELDGLKQRIGEFLLTKNPVRIDGQQLTPILDRTNYVKVGLQGIQLLEKPERLEISTAIVGVIITYITEGLPQEVTIDWELFTGQIQRVPATAIDPAGPLQTYVEPDDPVHRWQNFLKNYVPPTVAKVAVDHGLTQFRVPLLSLLCGAVLVVMLYRVLRRQARAWTWGVAGAALVGTVALYPVAQIGIARPAMLTAQLGDAQAVPVLEALLKNIYRAFDFREEGVVYDKLALSVRGDLLEQIYLQHRQSFAIQKAGGAQAKIKEVAVESASVQPREAGSQETTAEVTWTAMGSVGHWGHVHMRQNRYQAQLTLSPADGHWTVTGLTLLDEQRIDGTPAASGAASNMATLKPDAT
jgi:hypothetical protein